MKERRQSGWIGGDPEPWEIDQAFDERRQIDEQAEELRVHRRRMERDSELYGIMRQNLYSMERDLVKCCLHCRQNAIAIRQIRDGNG